MTLRVEFSPEITSLRKRVYLGTFDTAEEAGVAYRVARETMHPFLYKSTTKET